MSKIPLSTYLARNAPENAKKILQAWGMPIESNDPKMLARSLNTLFKSQGEGVLEDMGNLHPDKELILMVEDIKSGLTSSSADGKSGCGCGGNCGGEKKSGACGCSGFAGGGSWNSNEGSHYSENRNPNLDEFQVYGFTGQGDGKISNATIFFGAVAAFLAYQLYKNA